jgi:pimeloyl-ACP methyl ester carboxylesterase
MRRKLINGLAVIVAGLFLLSLAPVVVIGRAAPAWAPEPLQQWAYDVRLELGSPARKAASLLHGSLGNSRAYLDRSGQTVSFDSQGLTLAGTLYLPPTEGERPAILLLHGSTPEGRKLGLYRKLGAELAARGYVVLSIDQRGFGQSDNPATSERPADFDFVTDVSSAVTYLSSLPGVDTARLYVVGHSFGGDVAIAAGIVEPRLAKIVAIGPGRRIQERYAIEMAYFQRRMTRYMRLPQNVSAEVIRYIGDSLPIDNHLDYFTGPGHKPILLIDGAAESEDDRRFLQEICDVINGPKECVTLSDADHYANVLNVGALVIYDQEAVAALVETIDQWLTGAETE